MRLPLILEEQGKAWFLVDADGLIILSMSNTTPEDRAYILRACNNHEAVSRGVEQLLRILEIPEIRAVLDAGKEE